jgi:hypothetical protein
VQPHVPAAFHSFPARCSSESTGICAGGWWMIGPRWQRVWR